MGRRKSEKSEKNLDLGHLLKHTKLLAYLDRGDVRRLRLVNKTCKSLVAAGQRPPFDNTTRPIILDMDNLLMCQAYAQCFPGGVTDLVLKLSSQNPPNELSVFLDCAKKLSRNVRRMELDCSSVLVSLDQILAPLSECDWSWPKCEELKLLVNSDTGSSANAALTKFPAVTDLWMGGSSVPDLRGLPKPQLLRRLFLQCEGAVRSEFLCDPLSSMRNLESMHLRFERDYHQFLSDFTGSAAFHWPNLNRAILAITVSHLPDNLAEFPQFAKQSLDHLRRVSPSLHGHALELMNPSGSTIYFGPRDSPNPNVPIMSNMVIKYKISLT